MLVVFVYAIFSDCYRKDCVWDEIKDILKIYYTSLSNFYSSEWKEFFMEKLKVPQKPTTDQLLGIRIHHSASLAYFRKFHTIFMFCYRCVEETSE